MAYKKEALSLAKHYKPYIKDILDYFEHIEENGLCGEKYGILKKKAIDSSRNIQYYLLSEVPSCSPDGKDLCSGCKHVHQENIDEQNLQKDVIAAMKKDGLWDEFYFLYKEYEEEFDPLWMKNMIMPRAEESDIWKMPSIAWQSQLPQVPRLLEIRDEFEKRNRDLYSKMISIDLSRIHLYADLFDK